MYTYSRISYPIYYPTKVYVLTKLCSGQCVKTMHSVTCADLAGHWNVQCEDFMAMISASDPLRVCSSNQVI